MGSCAVPSGYPVPFPALCAVLLAALCHAIWNVEAKRAANSRHFVWLYSAASLVLWAPAVAWVLAHQHARLGGAQYLALGGTAVLHLLYSLALQAGYRAADLSIVYPVARGSGPLLSFVGATLLFGERPGWLALAGLSLIIAGIVLVANLHRAVRRTALPGLMWGALTGLCIAAYTLNDGWAVKALAVSPFLIDFSGNAFRVCVLSRSALADRSELALEWRSYRRPVHDRRCARPARIPAGAVRAAQRADQPCGAGARAGDARGNLVRRPAAGRTGRRAARRRRAVHRRRRDQPGAVGLALRQARFTPRKPGRRRARDPRRGTTSPRR